MAQIIVPPTNGVTSTMLDQDVVGASISLTSGFHIQAQDKRLKQKSAPHAAAAAAVDPAPAAAPLGVLENFTGTFVGKGFNTIFRPNSTPGSDNVLELNLTTETLSFSEPLGSVPNRGFSQGDIFLNGVPYAQSINDVTNVATGRADGTPSGIHFEPGIWMHVPATTSPAQGESLSRMGSIPHGTTINAQCLTPPKITNGPPTIPPVNITPFFIGQPGNTVPFPSQQAANPNQFRLPQDLSKFIAAGTITQDIVTNPNQVLVNAIAGQNISKTIEFTVSTTATTPGSGIANIEFLQGGQAPNANAIQMTATFYIETVQVNVTIPAFTANPNPPRIILLGRPSTSIPGAQTPIPKFTFSPPPNKAFNAPITITMPVTQIQYTQTVFLNFAPLTWPHVSCATLIPNKVVDIPASAIGM